MNLQKLDRWLDLPKCQDYHGLRSVRYPKRPVDFVARHPYDPVSAVDHERHAIPCSTGHFSIHQKVLQLLPSFEPKRAEPVPGPPISNRERVGPRDLRPQRPPPDCPRLHEEPRYQIRQPTGPSRCTPLPSLAPLLALVVDSGTWAPVVLECFWRLFLLRRAVRRFVARSGLDRRTSRWSCHQRRAEARRRHARMTRAAPQRYASSPSRLKSDEEQEGLAEERRSRGTTFEAPGLVHWFRVRGS